VYDDEVRTLGIGVLALVGIAGWSGGCGGGSGGAGAWKSYTAPGMFGVGAVWAFAPDDVWVGGQVIAHFDGAAFTEVPAPAGLVADFLGFASDDLYAVSGGSLLHWDGADFTAVDFQGTIDPTDLAAIWGTSRDDLWLGDTSNGQVHRWNGTRWSTTITQTVQVTDLWGSSTTDVLAAGIFGFSRWSGAAWTEITDPVVTKPVGLWGFSADDVWAVGDFSTLAHWDGTAWTDKLPVNNDNFEEDHESVWGAAPDDVWAVGSFGAISHWNGTGWSQVQVGTFPFHPFLSRVHGSSPDNVWAVGRSSDGQNAAVVLRLQR
jgi:hypothetical protein